MCGKMLLKMCAVLTMKSKHDDTHPKVVELSCSSFPGSLKCSVNSYCNRCGENEIIVNTECCTVHAVQGSSHCR